MSATADVFEMRDLCGDIAGMVTRSLKEKDRVSAVRSAIGRDEDGSWLFSWNRTLEFLRARARRVDSWEKDRAREVRDELKRAAREQRHRDHLEWLESEIGRFQASGEELHGPHIDGLVGLLRMARGADSAVAVPAEEPSDFSD